ncbi:putative iron-containing hydrogenase [Trypanosoma vivax]|nr:putative iron-containing hydrogenase [Trypanosoma vivax]
MSAAEFSSSLMLAGMDYIAPSEACVLPTVFQDSSVGVVGRHGSGGEVVKISLQDCLACSGCVTTAETILITSQSREEILKARSTEPTRPFLVTISDQSAAAIAGHLKRPIRQVYNMLSGFFRSVLGAQYVADLRWALHVSAEKTAKEYCRRMRHDPRKLPLIVSACPGWVCYCEKQGGPLLPLLCPVMSPQGIAGCYAKTMCARICHVSVQPCFDRKLEAVRDVSPSGNERYTDFVLSTQELLEWMGETDPSFPWVAPLDSALESPPPLAMKEPARAHTATMEGSGGYHRFAMHYAARELHKTELSPDDVCYETKRNANHQLSTSAKNPGEVYCVAYGFQQIQNTVRGLKRKQASVASYTFIELMACPGGCLNGGGQVRHGSIVNAEEALTAVNDAFSDLLYGDARSLGTSSSLECQEGTTADAMLETPVFTVTAFRNLEEKVGEVLWSCTFHDRQQEFEAALNNGGVHSLKW